MDVVMRENEIGTEIVAATVLVHLAYLLDFREAFMKDGENRKAAVWRNNTEPARRPRGAERRAINKNSSASQRPCARPFLPLIDPLSFRKDLSRVVTHSRPGSIQGKARNRGASINSE